MADTKDKSWWVSDKLAPWVDKAFWMAGVAKDTASYYSDGPHFLRSYTPFDVANELMDAHDKGSKSRDEEVNILLRKLRDLQPLIGEEDLFQETLARADSLKAQVKYLNINLKNYEKLIDTLDAILEAGPIESQASAAERVVKELYDTKEELSLLRSEISSLARESVGRELVLTGLVAEVVRLKEKHDV